MRKTVEKMSAEPLWTAAYSSDIGWRVVWLRISQECCFREISKRLQIGVGTAHRLFKRFELTGDVRPMGQSLRLDTRKLDGHHELYILGLIAENPGVNLQEICAKVEEATHVSVSGSTICRVLARNGFTRKKIMQVAKQRSIEFRGSFMANVIQYPHSFFVWVD